jgi:hypothetical protein
LKIDCIHSIEIIEGNMDKVDESNEVILIFANKLSDWLRFNIEMADLFEYNTFPLSLNIAIGSLKFSKVLVIAFFS